MTVRIESWDWRQSPDLDSLTRSLTALGVHVVQVDGGIDDTIIVLSDQPLTDAQAHAAWEADCVAAEAELDRVVAKAEEIADAAIPGK